MSNNTMSNILNKIASDEEHTVTSRVKLNKEKIPSAKETLNEEQSLLFDLLVEFSLNDKEYFVVGGYAGTGKTYTISKFVSCIESKVAVTAPTNKAVKILADNGELSMGGNCTYSTIHKLLALKLVWQPPKKKGDLPRQVLIRNTFAEVTLNEYSLIILDEASMLSYELFNLLHQEKDKDVKIIFMGDPAQIPPVNEIDSIPLLPEKRNKFQMDYFELSKIMRQANDSNILTIASYIRDNRFRAGVDIIKEFRKNDYPDVKFITSEEQFRNILLEYFDSEEFKTNSNYAKVIAWTNEVVDYYNKIIRQRIFKEEILPYIAKGDKLIADSPIFEEKNIVFNTSDEFEVVDYEISSLDYYIPIDSEEELLLFDKEEMKRAGKIEIKYYRALVKYERPVKLQLGEEPGNEQFLYRKIDILHEAYQDIYIAIIKLLAQRGKKTNRWAEYYNFMERFAKVKYNYAITAHKSQGSTYINTFIIESDIERNPRTIEKNRIKYTAFTRPKKMLFILTNYKGQ